jgi:non-specific serine/threonine protein kinase
MRLKQICNHPAQVAGTNDYRPTERQVSPAEEIAEEIASVEKGSRVHAVPRDRRTAGRVLATLFGRSGLVLHGDERQDAEGSSMIEREDGPPFFVLSLKAAERG